MNIYIKDLSEVRNIFQVLLSLFFTALASISFIDIVREFYSPYSTTGDYLQDLENVEHLALFMKVLSFGLAIAFWVIQLRNKWITYKQLKNLKKSKEQEAILRKELLEAEIDHHRAQEFYYKLKAQHKISNE